MVGGEKFESHVLQALLVVMARFNFVLTAWTDIGLKANERLKI